MNDIGGGPVSEEGLQRRLQKLAPRLGIATIESVLHRELKESTSVLELGTGRSSLALKVSSGSYLGIELHEPYVEAMQVFSSGLSIDRQIEVRHADILTQEFAPNQFSHVIMIDVLEHMPRNDGERLLNKMVNWASEAVIVKTPNGFVPQGQMDNNPLQEHLSGWSAEDFTSRGFSVTGLSGDHFLRRDIHLHDWTDDLAATMRWTPRNFWLSVAGLTQLYCSRIPSRAFELVAILRK